MRAAAPPPPPPPPKEHPPVAGGCATRWWFGLVWAWKAFYYNITILNFEIFLHRNIRCGIKNGWHLNLKIGRGGGLKIRDFLGDGQKKGGIESLRLWFLILMRPCNKRSYFIFLSYSWLKSLIFLKHWYRWLCSRTLTTLHGFESRTVHYSFDHQVFTWGFWDKIVTVLGMSTSQVTPPVRLN